jgi:phage shock protein C
MNKRLERIPREGAIAGVCAGLAIHNGWDKSWVRTLWVVGTFVTSMMGLFFIGPLVYIVLWITLPVRNDLLTYEETMKDPFSSPWQTQQPGYAPWTSPVEEPIMSPKTEEEQKPFTAYEPYVPPVAPFPPIPPMPPAPPKSNSGRIIVGLVLLGIGSILLIHQLDWIEWLDIRKYYPVIVSIIGLYLMATSFPKKYDTFDYNAPIVDEENVEPQEQQ